MKQIQIILGQNEAQITMELSEDVAARIFKDTADTLFSAKYGITILPDTLLNKAQDRETKCNHSLIAEYDIDRDTIEEKGQPVDSLVELAVQSLISKNSDSHEPDDRRFKISPDKKSLVLMQCPSCKGKFFATCKKSDTVNCKCGHAMDTDKSFIKGEYCCDKCKNITKFLCDENIREYRVKCYECKAPITVKFDGARLALNNY